MAATVEDAAIMMDALVGHDPADHFSLPTAPPAYRSKIGHSVEGMHIGVVRNWFLDGVDSGVARRFAYCLAALGQMGCELVDVTLPTASLANAGMWVVIRSEFAAMLLNRPELLAGTEAETRRRAGVGLLCTAADYVAAQRYRHVAQLEFEAVCRQVDMVITPGAPSTAGYVSDGEAWIDIDGDRRPWNESARTTTHFSYTGCPALIVPAGRSDHDGMPVAVQLAGMPDSEPALFQVGRAIEASVQ
jgi:aspartyl-tRNA(Asn)/glutamyl-tRNA(Gln) amidotransferase subunit A